MFLTKLLLNKEVSTQKDGVAAAQNNSTNLQAMIKDHLMNIQQNFCKKDDQQHNAKNLDELRQNIQ